MKTTIDVATEVSGEPEVRKVTVPPEVRRRQSGPRSGPPPPEKEPEAPPEAKPSARLKKDEEKPAYIVHDLAELLTRTQEPPPAAIDGLLSAAGLMLLSGRAKTNKTWLALLLCIAVATGRKWLGRRVRKGVAVYVNLEMSEYILGHRLNKLLGSDVAAVSQLSENLKLITIKTSALSNDELAFEVMSQVRRALKGIKPSVIIFDSFYNLAGGINENDIGDVSAVYREVQGLLEETGATGVMIHHFAKGDPSAKMGGDRAGGSRAHAQVAEAVVEVTPHAEDGHYVVSANVRAYKPIKDEVWGWDSETCTFNPEPDLDPADVKRVSRAGAKSKYQLSHVLSVLQAGESVTTKEWRDKIEADMSDSSFHRLRRRALNLKFVTEFDGKYPHGKTPVVSEAQACRNCPIGKAPGMAGKS